MLWINNKNISIFFSEKSDGDMLFAQTRSGQALRQSSGQTRIDADKRNEKVRINRIKFFEKHNINSERLVNLAGIHSADIAIARDSDLGRGALDQNTQIKNTDGLMTDVRNSYLMVTGADCFPVFFYDGEKKVLGIAHAGWRGILNYTDLRTRPGASSLPGEIGQGLNADSRRQTRKTKGVVEKIIYFFQNEFGSKPSDIQAWIGPGIKSCHFEVKNDVSRLFEKNYKREIINKGDKTYIDLPRIIAVQLTALGVEPAKIIEHPDCTYCEEDKYFSYRRDKPDAIEANAFIIHLK